MKRNKCGHEHAARSRVLASSRGWASWNRSAYGPNTGRDGFPTRRDVCVATAAFLAFGCEDTVKKSRTLALAHAEYLVPVAAADVQEVRTGLPLGERELRILFADDKDASRDPQAAQAALERARLKVLELRLAKSTFFAVATPDGTIIRNDQSQDLMAGENFHSAWASLRDVGENGRYKETLGSFAPANGVKGKPDAQWVAAVGIRPDDTQKPKGVYLTGWAWSLYCRRLEAALATRIADTEEGKRPLVYVFVVVGQKVYGTGPSPEVNAQAIAALDPVAALSEGTFSAALEITGRSFGLGVARAPALGEGVAIAVLRSET